MKKLLLSALTIAALTLSSCSRDNEDDNTNVVTIDPTNFQGTLKSGQTLTLDPSITYKLTGPFVVENGASVTFPAGTRVEASGGTSAYIAISQGAYIYVNGTASNPVIMTSANSSPNQSDWGGLVICGKAYTNKGGSTGQSALAEVSNLTYGGSDNNDSSGVIRYLRVEYTGAAFSSDKEFNGVSLFAVGSGTVFENVEAYMSGDDGIEFFGGAVNAKNLVIVNAQDDGLDFADGFTGSFENVFIKDIEKAGVEGSNNGDNFDATPRTNATLKNFTILKGSLAGSEHGMYLKEGTGYWNCQNIYIDGFTKGFKIKDATTDAVSNANVDNNHVIFNPVYFGATVTTQSEYAGTNTTYITVGANTGAGNSATAPAWTTGWTIGL
ncbi:hypothetical protein [Flavobacterium sp. NRK F7]|uniref:hypothetical protein n=1 Tax=Flavobacterium sp. NRK F7 TaxID=2954930 RepID=UPI00209192CB|nr:hypothetical protein [Flavobacterium sp. NRK F7]MCO6162038.1 hypothetical protein [Flavobacterium sp. NRK F7]